MINSTRTFLIWDGCIAAIISLAFASPLYAQALGGQRGKSGPSTLNFEDLTAKAVVTTQYNTRGVLFPRGAFLDTDALARSGTRVLRAANPTKEFHAGPLVIQFTSGQRRVRLFAGMMSGSKVPGTLRAFNVSNEMVGQDVKDVAPNGFTTAFEVSADRASIVRVELQMDGDEFESIDDLEFEGATAGLLPTKPPVVQLTSPISDAQLDVSSITVQGTVSGEGLLPTATLKMQARVSPESNAPQFTTTVQLSGSATTRTFSVPISGVSLGPIELIIETRNTGGLKGVAKVKITNLPAAIRARYTAEGGVSTFGDFRWGYGFKGAVYERGAIFAAGSNTTRVVRGAIFNKWLLPKGQSQGAGWLGRATAEDRNAPGGARAQDFEKGRIYSGLPTGAHYVPSVFVQAIEQLGGEAATGLPINDPSKSIATMQTWLFQQFRRPGQSGIPSTLEIRGTPPKLYVERQGGDLSPISTGGAPLYAQTPTIWQEFYCSGHEGPCNISPAISPRPIANAGERYCGGTTYLAPITDPSAFRLVGPPEWKAVSGDHVLTPILGVVAESNLADEDNPFTHECCIQRGSLLEDPLAAICSADWRVYVRPFHPYRNLFADNLKRDHPERSTVELEFEWCFAKYFEQVVGDLPKPGDMLFASGRWIIDCGHKSYNSEIHPPAVMAHMRTETYEGHTATVAKIWVNGWYTGDRVEFDIFPPPRPSPDATLVLVKPLDRDAAYNVNVQDFFVDSNRVRVRFTASPRRLVPITSAGEMKWQTGRAYYGRWHVYWSN